MARKPTKYIIPNPRNPFCLPNWRWLAAQELARYPTTSWDDTIEPAIKAAALFHQRLAAAGQTTAPPELHHQMPILAAAHGIYVAAGTVRDEVEARLLAAETFDTIATKTGVPAEVVAAYATYHFDVVHRLTATGWIIENAIRFGPFLRKPEIHEGDVWRYLGYFGGPVVLDHLIGDFFGRAETIPDSHYWAEIARSFVRDFAVDWTSPAEAGACVDRWCEFYRDRLHAQQLAGAPMLVNMLSFLRLANNLPPLPHGYFELQQSSESTAEQKLQPEPNNLPEELPDECQEQLTVA